MYNRIIIIIGVATLSLSVNAKPTSWNMDGAINAQTRYMTSEWQETHPSPYKLYKVDFPGLFLRLNTRNGSIDRIRLTQPNTEPFITESLVDQNDERDGRFVLHATETTNIFVLFDTIDGRLWRVNIVAKSPDGRLMPLQ